MWKLLLTALAVVLFTGAARAADAWAIGVGLKSCGAWTADRRTPDWGSEAQWVVGFLSGVGYEGMKDGVDPLRGVDGAAVMAWLDNYCQTHPLQKLVDAAKAFVDEHPH